MVHVAIDVAAVVENRAAQAVADEGQLHRKTQFLIENQNGETANRESAARISRPGLIEAESTQRLATASKKAFGKLNDVLRQIYRRVANGRRAIDGIAQGIFHAESGGTGEHEIAAERVIGRILEEAAYKAAVGAERFRGQADVHGVKSPAPGVAGIVATIARVGDTKTRDQRWLVVQRNFVWIHTQLGGHHPAKKVPI